MVTSRQRHCFLNKVFHCLKSPRPERASNFFSISIPFFHHGAVLAKFPILCCQTSQNLPPRLNCALPLYAVHRPVPSIHSLKQKQKGIIMPSSFEAPNSPYDDNEKGKMPQVCPRMHLNVLLGNAMLSAEYSAQVYPYHSYYSSRFHLSAFSHGDPEKKLPPA